MVTLKGLIRTISVSTEPHVVISLKFSKKSKLITFRNGSRLKLNFSQFRTMRDSYSSMKNRLIKQLGDDLFCVDFETFKFTGSLDSVCTVGDLLQKYEVAQIGEDLFRIKSDEIQLLGSSQMFQFIGEMDRGLYDCDCKGKTVLDIGGFQGESAIYFYSRGAKKVIVYEPVKSNYELIKQNLYLNDHVETETHLMGIGSKDGTLIIHYERIAGNFGIKSTGPHSMDIKVRNISEVIMESNAEIAKVDCEGAEESLVDVPNDILRKIKLYIIEVHGSRIRRALVKKFQNAGFRIKEKTWGNPELCIIFFSQ